MSETRRLCEVKNAMLDVALKILHEPPYKVPAFRFDLDELRCPNRDHCNPGQPCTAWRDPAIRERVARIEDRLFVLGFTRPDELDDYGREYGKEHTK